MEKPKYIVMPLRNRKWVFREGVYIVDPNYLDLFLHYRKLQFE